MPVTPRIPYSQSQDQIAEFLRADVTGDLKEVPGLGSLSIQALRTGKGCDKITTTFELIGKYLMLDANPDKFCAFLKTKGVSQHRVVTDAISEKCGLLLPGAGGA